MPHLVSFRQACRRFIYTENLMPPSPVAATGGSAPSKGTRAAVCCCPHSPQSGRATRRRGWLGKPRHGRATAGCDCLRFRPTNLWLSQAKRFDTQHGSVRRRANREPRTSHAGKRGRGEPGRDPKQGEECPDSLTRLVELSARVTSGLLARPCASVRRSVLEFTPVHFRAMRLLDRTGCHCGALNCTGAHSCDTAISRLPRLGSRVRIPSPAPRPSRRKPWIFHGFLFLGRGLRWGVEAAGYLRVTQRTS